jgi:hypothetical protein
MNRAAASIAAVLVFLSFSVEAQSGQPYKDGPVTEVSAIKVKSGKFDEYMAYLAGPYRELMDAQKQAGLIISWNIYTTRAGSPQEPDMYLTTTYANMAALDGLDDKSAPMIDKVFGSRKKSNDKFAARETMREVMGSELIQELTLR